MGQRTTTDGAGAWRVARSFAIFLAVALLTLEAYRAFYGYPTPYCYALIQGRPAPFSTMSARELFACVVLAALAAGALAHRSASRRAERGREMERALPGFLKDIAEGLRSGLPIAKCLRAAAKSDHGPLSPLVRRMADEVERGVPFADALDGLAAGTGGSPFIRQHLAILAEAQRSGGDLGRTAEAVASGAAEVLEIEEARRGRTASRIVLFYIIHIGLLAVVLLLYYLLKPLFHMNVSSSASSIFGSSGQNGLTLNSYRSLFMDLCYLEAFFTGLAAGIVCEGSVAAGIKHVLAMLALSFLMFAAVIKPEAIYMTPITMSPSFGPSEVFVLDGIVSRADCTPVKHASVGAVITCAAAECGGGSSRSDIVCELDPRCGMCTCVRTDNWGVYKLSLKAPAEAGDYQIKVVVVDDQATKARVLDTADFTVA